MLNETIRIYTDGACSGNPGPGGFGWILLFQDRKIEHAESEADTTNNRMELSAVNSALQYFDENKKSTKKYNIEIHTDSNLIVQAVNQKWLESWASKGWKKADKEPVKNRELWEALLFYINKYTVKFIWLKGHAGDEYNERCDTLARDASKGLQPVYHKSFKLVKSTESPNEAAKDNKISQKPLQKLELDSSLENSPVFVFEYNESSKEIHIEQRNLDMQSENFKEKSGEIVINQNNYEEFTSKLEQILPKLKKNEKK
jgi:ribonuclease HI